MTLTPKDFIGMEQAGDGWFGVGEIEPDVAEAFAKLVQRQRVVQDMIADARPSVAVIDQVAELLDQAGALLRPFKAEPGRHVHGRLLEIQGRGQALVPEYEIDTFEDGEVRGRITFGTFYRGGSGAIFGAAIPLFFDEIMSWVATNIGVRTVTAYLNVNFRGPTLVGQPLTFTVRADREEGRKIFVTGVLMQGDTLLADVDGMWIRLPTT
jgi:acyl-coenzyme A thioesterase PaaI-like protein